MFKNREPLRFLTQLLQIRFVLRVIGENVIIANAESERFFRSRDPALRVERGKVRNLSVRDFSAPSVEQLEQFMKLVADCPRNEDDRSLQGGTELAEPEPSQQLTG